MNYITIGKNSSSTVRMVFKDSSGTAIDLSSNTVQVTIPALTVTVTASEVTDGTDGDFTATIPAQSGVEDNQLYDGQLLVSGNSPVEVEFIAQADGDSGTTPASFVVSSNTTTVTAAIGGGGGSTENGVPVGGATGEVLKKSSATNYDTEWGTAGAGDLLASNNLSELTNEATARGNLGLGNASTASTGIANLNVPVFKTGVADDDFLRVAGASVEGRSASEVLADIGAAAASHEHNAGTDITSGTLPVARGGTGVTAIPMVAIITAADAAAARTVMGVTNSGSYTGQIETAADKDYILDPGTATGRTISGFYIKVNSGSGTVVANLYNGTDLVKQVTATTATGEQTSLANTTVTAGAVLKLELSSNSSATDVIFSVEYTE